MPKAKKEGPNGIDRWTNNGYGLVLDKPKKKPAKDSGKQKKSK